MDNEEKKPQDDVQERHVTLSGKPEVLDKVDYIYCNHAEFISSNIDFRIAFGDILPPEGRIKPLIGIVMTHQHALAFLQAMIKNVQKLQVSLQKQAAQVGAEAKEAEGKD